VSYDAVFLDVDGTLLWVDMDVRGYVEDLAPYRRNGDLTVESARGPVWKSLRRHIKENINHPTSGELARFKLENAVRTARELEIEAPSPLLTEVAERRISFNPYPEAEGVLRELGSRGLPLYVVSNWDILLEKVLRDLGWMNYFEAVVVSAVVGSEKPDGGIFEEAIRASGVIDPSRAVHVGNDPVSDVRGARARGLDAVLVDRDGGGSPEATATIPDLGGLPDLPGFEGK
jgi:putative hydrolase of the HAD superfamily